MTGNRPRNRTGRRILRRVGRILVVVTLLLLFTAAVDVYVYAARTDTQRADAAIVLGAAVFGDRPSPVLRERINHAISLYEDGYIDVIIFTGGLGRRDRLTEAEVARNYALDRGVSETAVLIETTSTSTRENLANAQATAAENGLQSFLIVSTPYHMRRAMALASDLGMEAYTSPTRSIRWISWYTKSRAYVREVVAYLAYLIVEA